MAWIISTIAAWVAGSLIKKILVWAGISAIGAFLLWGYVKLNYVPKYKYQDALQQIEYQRAVIREKDTALEDDAAQAAADLETLKATKEELDAYEARGDDPITLDQRDVDWLQNLGR